MFCAEQILHIPYVERVSKRGAAGPQHCLFARPLRSLEEVPSGNREGNLVPIEDSVRALLLHECLALRWVWDGSS